MFHLKENYPIDVHLTNIIEDTCEIAIVNYHLSQKVANSWYVHFSTNLNLILHFSDQKQYENEFFFQFCFLSQVENILNFTMPKESLLASKQKVVKKLVLSCCRLNDQTVYGNQHLWEKIQI